MRQQNKKTPLVFRVGIFLLCALLCSAHLMGGLYARYSTSVTASDSARVAYVVAAASGEAKSQENIVDAAKDIAYEYLVTVSNVKDEKISEVSLKYTICVELPENFPENMRISVDKTTPAQIQTDEVTRIFEFVSAETLAAGIPSTNEHLVTIAGTDQVVDGVDNLVIKISIKAEQID